MSSSTRKLRRDTRGAMLGGVCAGLARRLGVDPLIVRVGMVVITIGSGGIAAICYLLAWGLVPAETATGPDAESGRRRGSWRIAVGVAFLVLSLLLVFRQLDLWWSDKLVWPLVLAAFGVALLWSLSRPEAEAEQSVRAAAREPVEPELEEPTREAARRVSRAGFGAALVLGAGLLSLWANGVLDAAGDVALAALVVTVAIALISAPVWWGMVRRLTVERSARIRAQERSEVAAHLHDSVLQTLALVQRRAENPGEVAKLARHQERELRSWLAGQEAKPGERLADALRAAAADVEESHGAQVEAVVVGDAALDERLEALVAATREALTNAAKFASEDGDVRLYAEIENGTARVFVDDRGPGFDPDAIPADRRGLRESIIGRMERHGGSAAVHSAPGEGTEIELTMESARA